MRRDYRRFQPEWGEVPEITAKVDRRNVFLTAAALRYQDALALRRADRYLMAVYMGGYAVECLLKVLVCDHFAVQRLSAAQERINRRPERRRHPVNLMGAEGHNLALLLEYAGWLSSLRRRPEWDDFRRVNRWTVALRYFDHIVGWIVNGGISKGDDTYGDQAS